MRFAEFLATCALLVACSDPAPGPGTDTPSDDAGTSTSGTSGSADPGNDPTVDPDTETGDSDTTDSTGPTEPETGDAPTVRFVALGDAGKGYDDQKPVADTIKEVCDTQGCDFAIYLGDNFYDSGVDGVEDPQWEDKFELPYAELDFPFYAVMGNHDLGFDGLGLEFWKAPYYVEYTQYSDKWIMHDTHYTFEWEHVMFFALDTTEIFFTFLQPQQGWVEDELANLPPHIEHTIAFGHHPYISNGQHGNAGNYEGIPDWVPLMEIPRGDFVRDFMEQTICGNMNLYFSGHDHNRQLLEPECGTNWIVSGAGAKTTDLVWRNDNPTYYDDDLIEGFMWVEIVGDAIRVESWDMGGTSPAYSVSSKL